MTAASPAPEPIREIALREAAAAAASAASWLAGVEWLDLTQEEARLLAEARRACVRLYHATNKVTLEPKL